MDDFSKSIWQRGNAWKIMKEARRRFRVLALDPKSKYGPDRFVMMASTHYSLVKRYRGILLPFAVYHLWRATVSARKALHSQRTRDISLNEADVVCTILSKSPNWIGGDKEQAYQIIQTFLRKSDDVGKILPHTKALMHITLAQILQERGKMTEAREHIIEARYLVDEIPNELSKDRDFQYVRVRFAINLFFCDHGDYSERKVARFAFRRDLERAIHVGARDQELKILAEVKKRGIKLD